MKRPRAFRAPAGPKERINGRIRAREVRVVGPQGAQIGILSLHEAINLARGQGMDLVEVAANANPPVCRIVDYGKFRYEQSKKEKESRKSQHVGRVKEVQLRPGIDEHDFKVKLNHAIEFLCEDNKVKLNLRYRGREMAHQEIGIEVVNRFINQLGPWGTSPEPPRKAGRNVNAIVNPLPRARRAPNPHGDGPKPAPEGADGDSPDRGQDAETPKPGFTNNPFDQLDGHVD
ncbi:MAG: translation initiation factor IF-3 [Verrucomicrobiales bacterium]|nr:translation initiation factor IF-3 [Verrucomicrobiales bacterium]MCP5527140.1 translation initiation factor IF-3 [Verrucomicrobiales bacterium]